MDKVSVTLRVFFEEPFWIGLLEKQEDGKLSVCRIVYGAEPREYEVEEHILIHFWRLRFSPAVKAAARDVRIRPKQRQREARKVQEAGIGTKAQQALKLQYEEQKEAGKARKRERKEADAQLRFEQKQQKKKEKHRGR